MLAALIAAMLSIVPQDCGVVRDRVYLVEVNHFFDYDARPVFSQVIFYEWSPAKGRHQVLAWRLLKQPCQLPQRDYTAGSYIARWNDGETSREVRAATYRETWSQYDPELENRKELPNEKRKGMGAR